MPETTKPPPNLNPAPSSALRPLTKLEKESLLKEMLEFERDARKYFRKKREAPKTGQLYPKI
jgi:hypothetical protein